jgi:hypothetical protein
VESGPVYGREAIEKHYKDLFQNVHFSNNHTTYNDPHSNSPSCYKVQMAMRCGKMENGV